MPFGPSIFLKRSPAAIALAKIDYKDYYIKKQTIN